MDRIVSVEILPERNQARLWRRDGDNVSNFDIDFAPWLISSFRGSSYGAKISKLYGENAIKWMHEFGDIDAYNQARHVFPYGKSVVFDDLRNQFLTKQGEFHMFQNMKFEELVRFTLDIETTGLNPDKNRLLMIAISHQYGEQIICSEDEAEMIRELEQWIQMTDPDVIEGWNIFGFDIPFLMNRALVHGMELNWGRSDAVEGVTNYGAPVTIGKKWKFRVGSYDMPVKTFDVFGRHVLDGKLVAMRYDSNTGGAFESYSLKPVAKEMGLQSEDRVLVDASNMPEEWAQNRERVMVYCAQDVQETRDLIALMVQPEYYLTTLLPDTFQNILLSGGATKVNQLLISQYVREGYAIPIPPGEREDYEGGAVECRLFGVYERVAKADVSSLYPSIMLYVPVAPRFDNLGAFHRTLESLTQRRLRVKAEQGFAKNEATKKYLKGIQESYKILINSFYGYLATGMHFSDFAAAANVTRIGRGIVVEMADQLEALGLTPIEVDTDGVFFQYPVDFPLEHIPDFLSLLDWVVVEVDGPYKAMLSIKAKNYVLLKDEGKPKYHGNSIRSRRDERFGRSFINEVVGLLLDGHHDVIPTVYKRYQDRILKREFESHDLAKRERITDKTTSSPAKAKLRAAVEQTELVEGDFIRVYQSETGEYQPVEKYANDSDRYYYLERLFKFAQRLDTVLDVYKIELPKVSKAQWYVLAGIEPPKRSRKAKEIAV